MGKKRDQSQCKECEYIWYPREKREVCPKCKSERVAYAGGIGRRLVVTILLLGVVAAVGGAGYWKFVLSDPAEETADAEGREPAELIKPKEEAGLPKPEPAPVEEKTDEEPKPAKPSDSLTGQRTWTAKDGRTLDARLLKLDLLEGQYVGNFEKPDGETFSYKIGNLSPADVELVKGLVSEE